VSGIADLVERLRSFGEAETSRGNTRTVVVDLRQQLDDEVGKVWRDRQPPTLPWLVVRYPNSAPEADNAWSGALTDDNVGRLLRGVGLGFEDVVRSTVYLVDFANRDAYNRIYREYFPTEPPTRATVEVTRLALGARIEIEVTAAR
jgi:2-iminobutanoate/2-iminopropanoate deaminase